MTAEPILVDDLEPEIEFADGEPTLEERRRFEEQLVEIVADVIVARRTIAA